MSQARLTDGQTIGFFKQADAGVSVQEICRSSGMSQGRRSV